jgi:hypothetical protein
MSKKQTPTAPEKRRLPIDDKIVELRKQRIAALTQILELEAAGATPEKPVEGDVNIDHAALRLLDGGTVDQRALVQSNPNARLYQFRFELEVIDRALVFAEQRQCSDHIARSRELAGKHQDEWLDLQRQRAEMVIGILTVNRKIEGLKASIRSGGQLAGLPFDDFTPRLFGVGRLQNVAGHFAIEFLKAAARAGLITDKDFRDV